MKLHLCHRPLLHDWEYVSTVSKSRSNCPFDVAVDLVDRSSHHADRRCITTSEEDIDVTGTQQSQGVSRYKLALERFEAAASHLSASKSPSTMSRRRRDAPKAAVRPVKTPVPSLMKQARS